MSRRWPIASRPASRRRPASPERSKGSSRRVRRRSTGSPLLFAAAVAALFQVAPARTLAMQAAPAADFVDTATCPLDPGEYERQGYRVRHVLVRGAFDLFQLRQSTSVRLAGVELPIEGAPFSVDRTVAAAEALERRLHQPLPGTESRFAVTIVVSNIERCIDEHGDGQLDIRFRTVTSRFPAVSGMTIESREAQRADPAAAAGALGRSARVTAAPAAAYNASDGFQAGGTISLRHIAGAIDSAEVQALAAPRSHLVRAALAGSGRPHLKGLDTATWQIAFADEERAGSVGDQFGINALRGQFIGQTLPFGTLGAVFRFAGAIEGGHQQAQVASGAGLLDDHQSYAALRAAAGITAGGRFHSAAASYGVLLGHAGGDATIGYRKHIADFAWDSQLPIADHAALRIEGRLNAGWLLGAEAAPLAERFRGGNREQTFLDGGAWMIRSNPFLRSIPSNRLDRTAPDASIGGERFVAMNATLSAPVWRYPLIPVWLSRSKGFQSGLEAAKETGRNQAIVYYQSQDPAQKLMEADAAQVTSVLDTLFDGLSAARSGVDAAQQDTFDDCLDAADTGRDKMTHLKETGFGPIATSVVPGVAAACIAELAAALPPQTLSARLEELQALGT